MEASADHQKNQSAGGYRVSESSKSGVDFYSGAVAQRALFGPSRCRGGARRTGGKDCKPAPSRLSKMSSADNS